MIKANMKLLKEVDEVMEPEDRLYPDPAEKCWNCGESEWNGSGYCRNCGEHWRGK